MKQTGEASRYDWSTPTNIDFRNQCTVSVQSQFDNLQKTSDLPNEDYENFVTAHKEAAAKFIPTKPRGKCRVYRIHVFSSFKISNKNILKNILEI